MSASRLLQQLRHEGHLDESSITLRLVRREWLLRRWQEASMKSPIQMNRYRAAKLARCRELLAMPAPTREPDQTPDDYRDLYQRLTCLSLRDCPQCGQGQMIHVESFLPSAQPRGPPEHQDGLCIA